MKVVDEFGKDKIASNAAVVGELFRHQLTSVSVNDDDGYLHEDIIESSFKFIECIKWGKLEAIKALGMHGKMLEYLINEIINCNVLQMLPNIQLIIIYIENSHDVSIRSIAYLLNFFLRSGISRIQIEVSSYTLWQTYHNLLQDNLEIQISKNREGISNHIQLKFGEQMFSC
jgi:hypothetical protein